MEKRDLSYICPYCKAKHETPGELARCILNCEDKIQKEEERKRREQLIAEKDSRFQEVIDAYKHADALRDKVVEDYGYFTYGTKSKGSGSHDWFWNTIGLF